MLKVCLRSLRILSRDKKVLGPLITDRALLTLAHLGGISNAPVPKEDADGDADPYNDIIEAISESKLGRADEDDRDDEEDDGCGAASGDTNDLTVWSPNDWCGERKASTFSNMSLGPSRRRSSVFKALTPGKRDSRGSLGGGEEEEEKEEKVDDEGNRKEVMKIFCNIVYNSAWAQERASELRYEPFQLTVTNSNTSFLISTVKNENVGPTQYKAPVELLVQKKVICCQTV